jgi:hypothetical protein
VPAKELASWEACTRGVGGRPANDRAEPLPVAGVTAPASDNADPIDD